jgi:hypothetical protein
MTRSPDISTTSETPQPSITLTGHSGARLRGKATPQRDLDLIDNRLKRAAEMHAQKMKESGQ